MDDRRQAAIRFVSIMRSDAPEKCRHAGQCVIPTEARYCGAALEEHVRTHETHFDCYTITGRGVRINHPKPDGARESEWVPLADALHLSGLKSGRFLQISTIRTRLLHGHLLVLRENLHAHLAAH
ncbi:MAG: hypothetical protein ABIG71_02665 [Candidatus Uhrbacteria bacterium]